MRKEAIQTWFDNFPGTPQPGMQTDIFLTDADITLGGGAAGGGKSFIAALLSLTMHRETLYMRREATQLGGVIQEYTRLLGNREGYNGTSKTWAIPAEASWDGVARQLRFGSVPHLGDETRYQGLERDLLVIDEAANFLEEMVTFLMGWVRSPVKGQRCRTLLMSNPPTSSEGAWLREWFAPWLDKDHPDPAKPGELRWMVRIDNKMEEVEDNSAIHHKGESLYPQSYTYLPSKVIDNKYLANSGYLATLQALPEPLRSMMLHGDWDAGKSDAEMQVIPSAWVDLAMNRKPSELLDSDNLSAIGVDPSRGGEDDTVIASRSGWLFHKLQCYPGSSMPTGKEVLAKALEIRGNNDCPVYTDVIGIGSSVQDLLELYIGADAIPINVSAKADKSAKDFSGNLNFANKRAQLWWSFRDLLNPENGKKICLPNDKILKAQLCSPTYEITATGIKIESKDRLRKRLGTSTDRADAVLLAAIKRSNIHSGFSSPFKIVNTP